MTALAGRLYLLSCYLYVALILISFEDHYIQGNITIKPAWSLTLHKHGFFSSFVDLHIGIGVSLIRLHVSLRLSLCLFGKNTAYKAIFHKAAVWYSQSWAVVLFQVLCSVQVAPAEVPGHEESHQKRSDGGPGERIIHESGQTKVRSCK